jgi:hypothetical protein
MTAPDILNLRHLVDKLDEGRLRSGLREIRKYIKTVLAAEDARAGVTHEQEDTPRRRPWSLADTFPELVGWRGNIHFPTKEEQDQAAEIRRRLEERRGPLYDAIRNVVRLSVTKTLDEIDDDDVQAIIHQFAHVPEASGYREESA